MTETTRVDIADVLDRARIGPVRVLAVALSALVVLLDGFDLQIIGLAAPFIAGALHIPTAALGTVFSAAVAGMALGGIGLAPLADRVGRKTVLVIAVLCFAAFTLATVTAAALPALLAYRFLTGLGLGAAIPCAVSLASELVPARHRATIAGVLFTGFPIGGVVCGLLGSRMIPATGWRGLFLVGGLTPLVVVLLIIMLLPESPVSLVARGVPADRVRRVLARVAPDADVAPTTEFTGVVKRGERAPVRELLGRGRRWSTALLWAASFVAFGVLVVNSSWSPTLLAPLGVPVPRTAVALALFNAGSVVATAAGGWLITKFGARRVIPVAFALAAVGIGGIGLAAPSLPGVSMLQVLVGLGLGCASSGVIALAAIAYPTAIRSTGVGWALGVGRIGSFTGPLVVAALVAAAWAAPGVFGVLGVACLAGALAAAALHPVTAESPGHTASRISGGAG